MIKIGKWRVITQKKSNYYYPLRKAEGGFDCIHYEMAIDNIINFWPHIIYRDTTWFEKHTEEVEDAIPDYYLIEYIFEQCKGVAQ